MSIKGLRVGGALRQPFELGVAEAGRTPGTWVMLVVLLAASAASFSFAIIAFGLPLVSGPWVEVAIPDGAWVFTWGGNSQPAAVEQQEQVRALRMVAGGAASLMAVLCLLTVAGLWRQRQVLRRHEHFVHWAIGARKLQIAAKTVGEARPWFGGAVGVGSMSAAIVAAVVDRSFPGAAFVTPNMAAAAILLSAIAVVLVRWEGSAGNESQAAERGRFWELFGSPPMIGAIGFAALSGIGLLALHAPDREAGATVGAASVASVALAGIPMAARGEDILEWTERARRSAGAEVGFASAGASRATGRWDQATVQCGECFEGVWYMPLKIVGVEVYAVAPDTFAHLGMTLSGGRDFDDALDRGAPNTAIVNRALAARHFEDGNPLGRMLMIGESGWLTVVGVVEGIDAGPGHEAYAVYLPLAQARPADIEVLSAGPVTSLQPVLDVAPAGAAFGEARSLAETFATHRWFRAALNAMGAAALLLLGAGSWVSAANEAGAARHEIAVRRAVGATLRSFWSFYLGFAGRRLAFALIVGAWLSLFLGAGLQLAYASIPQIDWRIWCVAAVWVSATYVFGSLRLILRAASAPLMDALETSS
jgi:hypothetical protein